MKGCKRSSTIKPLGCPLWSTEHESNRTRTHDSYTTPWDTILDDLKNRFAALQLQVFGFDRNTTQHSRFFVGRPSDGVLLHDGGLSLAGLAELCSELERSALSASTGENVANALPDHEYNEGLCGIERCRALTRAIQNESSDGEELAPLYELLYREIDALDKLFEANPQWGGYPPSAESSSEAAELNDLCGTEHVVNGAKE